MNDSAANFPHDIVAEMSVLGSMLFGGSAAVDAADELLNLADFYRPAHGYIFAAMRELVADRSVVDPVTLRAKLAASELLESVGGDGYIFQLDQLQFTTEHLSHYAKIVKDHAVRRRAMAAADDLWKQAQNTELDPGDMLRNHENALSECDGSKQGTDWLTIRDLQPIFHESMKQRIESGEGLTGISTGLQSVDRATRGFRDGELILVAARPAMGKTAWVTTVALNCAKAGVRVAFLSAEMGRQAIMDRIISAESRVPLTKILTARYGADEDKKMRDAIQRLMPTSLAIDDTPNVSVSALDAKVRRFKTRFGGVGLVIVDYLQYLEASEGKKHGSRREEVTDIARRLKSLSRVMKCPVIALSQLSRAVEHREDKRPMLSDLYESGGLEAEADIVSFLYRPSYYSRDKQIQPGHADEVEFIVAKNRNGPVGTVKLAFLPEITRFDDLSEGRY